MRSRRPQKANAECLLSFLRCSLWSSDVCASARILIETRGLLRCHVGAFKAEKTAHSEGGEENKGAGRVN